MLGEFVGFVGAGGKTGCTAEPEAISRDPPEGVHGMAVVLGFFEGLDGGVCSEE